MSFSNINTISDDLDDDIVDSERSFSQFASFSVFHPVAKRKRAQHLLSSELDDDDWRGYRSSMGAMHTPLLDSRGTDAKFHSAPL
jgi:hypothetical protein